MLYRDLKDMITIDRRSTVDFDIQIKENIKALIQDKTLFYKKTLPTTEELAEQLSLDEKIIKKAYDHLQKERYIKQKNDTFSVSYIELTNYFFERNTSIYDAVIELGLTPSIKCLEKKVVTLSDEDIISMGFEVTDNKEYLYINRLYYGDNQPIIILENYLPLHIFEGLDKEFHGHEPLNDYIGKRYGFQAHISKRITKAVNLPKELATLLNERVNAASIQSTNQVYDKFGRMIDFGQSHSVGSYYFQALMPKTEINDYIKEFRNSNNK